MATRRRPQPKKIKFELTRSSIAGIGVVTFCIFLWMFLLGVWTGQSMLLPSTKPEKTVMKKSTPPPTREAAPQRIEAQSNKKIFGTKQDPNALNRQSVCRQVSGAAGNARMWFPRSFSLIFTPLCVNVFRLRSLSAPVCVQGEEIAPAGSAIVPVMFMKAPQTALKRDAHYTDYISSTE